MSSQPQWINWNDGQGFRKLTSIQGGPSMSGNLTWFDWNSIDPTEVSQGGSNNFGCFTYNNNPYNLFMVALNDGENNGRLIKTPNPFYSVQQSDGKGVLYTDNCLNNYKSPQDAFNSLPKNPEDFSQAKQCDQVSCDDLCAPFYNCDQFHSSIGCDTENSNVSQCINTTNDIDSSDYRNNNWCYGESGSVNGGRMGLDDSKTFQDFHGYISTNGNMYYAVGTSKICSKLSNFSPGGNPPVQLIDEINAVKCCSLDAETISQQEANGWTGYPMCSQAFNPDPNASNKCHPVVSGFCNMGNWQNEPKNVKDTCINFLENSPLAPQFIQNTSYNYIINRAREDKSLGSNVSAPQDYVSRDISSSNPVSNQYYSNAKFTPSGESCSGSNCGRDDSKDPFFKDTLPMMCNQQPGVCDNFLNYFCAQYSSQDIQNELSNGNYTLRNLCGCHLKQQGSDESPPGPSSPEGAILNLQGVQQTNSPYNDAITIGGIGCNPLCINSTLQNQGAGGKCETPQCVINDVTIDIINSSTGNINIGSVCGGCGDGQCSCYISDVSINEINSTSNGINILQECGQCYTYTGNDVSNATPVDCTTLQPSSVDGGGGVQPPSSSLSSFIQNNKRLIIVILIVLLVVFSLIIFGVILKDTSSSGKVTLTKQQYQEIISPSGYSYADYNY